MSEDKINKKLNTLMHKRPVLFVALTITLCLLMAFIISLIILFIFG